MARNSSIKAGRTARLARAAVLSAVIEEHLITGDAIGSQTVSDSSLTRTGWSSATIRSVMCELEDFGFLGQPHTSAGEFPPTKVPGTTSIICWTLRACPKMMLRAIEGIDMGPWSRPARSFHGEGFTCALGAFRQCRKSCLAIAG